MSARINYAFAPSAERARLLDQRMRSSLGQSLSYLSGELQAHAAIDSTGISHFVERLEKESTPPLSFAIYWDLVCAIDADDLTSAGEILDLLIHQPPCAPRLSILDLRDRRADASADRYIRYIDTDPDMPLDLLPPPAPAAEQTREKIRRALALMESGDPKLAAEVKELLREIILCAGSPDPNRHTFDGASSFMLWGAIFINAQRSGDDLSMVQMLAHESAHNLLFGLSPEERLVTNDPSERHASPLRLDPRPLEGIYHATYVSARMYRAMKQLADSGVLSPEEKNQALLEAAQNKKAFLDGLGILDRHARFTETGKAILDGAREYILSN